MSLHLVKVSLKSWHCSGNCIYFVFFLVPPYLRASRLLELCNAAITTERQPELFVLLNMSNVLTLINEIQNVHRHKPSMD